MTDEEWPTWWDVYKKDAGRRAGAMAVPVDELRSRVVGELDDFLSEGFSTPEHRFLIAEDDETDERIGSLWIHPVRDSRKVCHPHAIQVEVDDPTLAYRRAMMQALEAEARRAGYTRIGLAVSGSPTIRLVEELGYHETGRDMVKDLTEPG